MAPTSTTNAPPKGSDAQVNAKKDGLLARHKGAIEKVVVDAMPFSADRKRDLDGIGNETLRKSARR